MAKPKLGRETSLKLEGKSVITAETYKQYIKDFNDACAGDGTGFDAFYDKYYEPDAVFEYIPNATKNKGKKITVAFWEMVHGLMREKI